MGCSASTTASSLSSGAVEESDFITPTSSRSSGASSVSSYDIHERLGEGGFASVHRARCRSRGVDFATKSIDLSGSERKRATLVARAEDEVAVWRHIGAHEHVVSLVDAFVDGEAYRMVMEMCGASLLDRLDDVRGLERGVGHVFREMCLGVRHLHARSVLHRDLKPANFLLGGPAGETVKVCDFGFATVIPEAGVAFNGVVGSPSYMAPEVIAEAKVTTQADMWSLGVTCFVVLYKKLPYVSATGGDNRDVIASGVPAPCYEAGDDVEPMMAGDDDESEDFVRSLLRRGPLERRTADEALCHGFVAGAGCGGEKTWQDAESWDDESTAASLSSECESIWSI